MTKGFSVAVATMVIVGTVVGSSYAVEVLDTIKFNVRLRLRRPQASWYPSHPSSACRLIKDHLEPMPVLRCAVDLIPLVLNATHNHMASESSTQSANKVPRVVLGLSVPALMQSESITDFVCHSKLGRGIAHSAGSCAS